MIEPKYSGEFADRASVAKEYEEGTGLGYREEFQIAPDFPTDDQILYASYEAECYEGYSYVLFERDGKIFEVNGSHCSCMGLEGQWKPEETSWDAIAIRKPDHYGAPREVITEAKKRVQCATHATPLQSTGTTVDPPALITAK